MRHSSIHSDAGVVNVAVLPAGPSFALELVRGRARCVECGAVVAQLEVMVMFAKLANDPDLLDDLWPQIALLLTTATSASIAASVESPRVNR